MAFQKQQTYNGFTTYKETAAYTGSATSSAIPGFSGGSLITVTMQGDGTTTCAQNTLTVQLSLDGTNWSNIASGISCTAVTASASSVSAAVYDMTLIMAPYIRLVRALTANGSLTWTVAIPGK